MKNLAFILLQLTKYSQSYNILKFGISMYFYTKSNVKETLRMSKILWDNFQPKYNIKTL